MRLSHKGSYSVVTATLLMMTLLSVRMAHAQAVDPGNVQSNPGTQIAEIVVTAQKRSENILFVPESVTFLSSESLEAQHATQLQDYAAYVPGLQVDSSGSPGQTTITLRGIAPLGSGAAVGTYIDDAPIGSSSLYSFSNTFQLDLLPYDLKGIEVLRGPQGTLYGASTMGGLIKYALQSPDSERFSAAVGGDLMGVKNGKDAGGGLRAMVNLPVIEGVLAFRGSAFYENTPGYVDDPIRSERGINGVRQEGGRLALGWTPNSELQDDLEVLVQRTTVDGDATVALDPTGSFPPRGDLTINTALSQPFFQSTEFVKNSAVWSLPIVTLTSVSSYSDTRNHQTQDASAVFGTFFPAVTGAIGYSPQVVDVRLHKFTEELRLASVSGARLEWMAGVFVTYERAQNQQAVNALGSDFLPNAVDPILIASIPSRYREQAGFGDLSWRVVGGWSVSGGLRYSHNSQNYEQITAGLLSPGAPAGGESSQDVTTYNVSTKYQFTPQTMLYARVASGYQPGGPNVALAGVPPTVGASTLTNYEAGFKTETFEDRLMLDLSIYRIDWKKIQTTATTQTGLQYLLNGGEARSQGVEVSGIFKASKELSLRTSFAYTDATFTTGFPNLGIIAGQRLPAVPRVSASVAPEYDWNIGSWDAEIGAGVRYVGARPAYLFVAPKPPVTFNENSYVLFDFNARLGRDGWTVALYGKNLLDKRVYLTKTGITDALTGSIVQVDGALLQPRTIGVSLDRKF
ncbi:MAG: TonB-dependent receptor [Pseudomonadota bacterium]|nr:TonB-dependent receptor [Pseudomonadota bacterium]